MRRVGATYRIWLLAGGCVLALCTATAAAQSAYASASSLLSRLEVSSGSVDGVGRVEVVASSRAGASCSLRVTAGGLVKLFAARSVRSGGRIAWSWDPPPPVSQAPWEFLARCAFGARFAWRRAYVEMGFPSLAGALNVAVPVAGRVCDAQGLCFVDDPFPVGQCTWYAEGRRPDLLGIVHGNAGGWLQAAKGRAPEGTTPVKGALAVWLANTGPAGALGHVAYVAAVAGGRILVDDSNWRPTPTSSGLEVHEHWEPADSPAGYIYGGPAGGGPS